VDLCETKQRQQVFDVGSIEEFEPAKFDVADEGSFTSAVGTFRTTGASLPSAVWSSAMSIWK
jgi:hypothetical protein